MSTTEQERPTWLVWLDLETTGSDENADPILEIGVVLTDERLNEIDDASWVVKGDAEGLKERAADVVKAMHEANGLWNELANGCPLASAEDHAISFLKDYGNRHDFILCGSGVSHFDRRFLASQMPTFTKWFRYYSIDVGVLRRSLNSSAEPTHCYRSRTRPIALSMMRATTSKRCDTSRKFSVRGHERADRSNKRGNPKGSSLGVPYARAQLPHHCVHYPHRPERDYLLSLRAVMASRERTIMTPREQLIDLIENVEVRYDLGDYARSVVGALEKSGVVVLTPVKAEELTKGQRYTDREPLLAFVHPCHWGFDGSPHLSDPEATVYVNALEGEQS
jgi:oligoribonuclease (3'-5' exoribonuclease)